MANDSITNSRSWNWSVGAIVKRLNQAGEWMRNGTSRLQAIHDQLAEKPEQEERNEVVNANGQAEPNGEINLAINVQLNGEINVQIDGVQKVEEVKINEPVQPQVENSSIAPVAQSSSASSTPWKWTRAPLMNWAVNPVVRRIDQAENWIGNQWNRLERIFEDWIGIEKQPEDQQAADINGQPNGVQNIEEVKANEPAQPRVENSAANVAPMVQSSSASSTLREKAVNAVNAASKGMKWAEERVVDGLLYLLDEGPEEVVESQPKNSETPISYAQAADDLEQFANSINTAKDRLLKFMRDALDEQVYEVIEKKWPKDQYGRYIHITTDRNDPLFYYLHVLNLLIALPQSLIPIAEIERTYVHAIGENSSASAKIFALGEQFLADEGGFLAAGKKLLFSKEDTQFNKRLNRFSMALRYFVHDLRALDPSSSLDRAPSIGEAQAILKNLPFVQMAQEQFDNSPVTDFARKNADHWQEFMKQKLPKNKNEKAKANTKDQDYMQEMLSKLSDNVDGLVMALEVLKDSDDKKLTPEMKKNFEKTIEAVKKTFATLQKFSGRRLTWKNMFNLIYKLLPDINKLVDSIPLTYVATDKLLRDRLLVSVRQLNLVFQEGFLYMDRMESFFDLKDGLTLPAGDTVKSCGLLTVDFDPMDQNNLKLLQELLGSNDDAYVMFGDNFYYFNKWHDVMKPLVVRPVKIAVTDEPLMKLPVLASQPKMENADAKYLKKKLSISPEIEKKQKNNWLFERLSVWQLEYIKSLTQHERDKNFLLANQLNKFNDFIKAVGYELPRKECYPYHDAILRQRQALLNEHRQKMKEKGMDPDAVKDDDQSPDAIKLRQLQRRVNSREKLLSKQREIERERVREERVALSRLNKNLAMSQIDNRIQKLESDKLALEKTWGKWVTWIFSLTRTKEEKIKCLRALNHELNEQIKGKSKEPKAQVFLNVDEALDALRKKGHDVKLLLEGRTGKMVHTLKALSGNRFKLITDEIKHLEKEIKQDQKYFFFAEWRNKNRCNHLNKRIQALKKFRKEWTKRSGYRLQGLLDHFKGESAAQYQELMKETELLKLLRENDSLSPNAAIGRKNLGLFSLPKPARKAKEALAAPVVNAKNKGNLPSPAGG